MRTFNSTYMGVLRTTTTPAPVKEREETLSGIGNIDNSKINTKKNTHLYTLVSIFHQAKDSNFIILGPIL